MAVHENLKKFKCQICEFEFTQKCSLKKHIMFVHEKQKPFKCAICQKDFSRKLYLIDHIKSQHPAIKKLISDQSETKIFDLKP